MYLFLWTLAAALKWQLQHSRPQGYEVAQIMLHASLAFSRKRVVDALSELTVGNWACSPNISYWLMQSKVSNVWSKTANSCGRIHRRSFHRCSGGIAAVLGGLQWQWFCLICYIWRQWHANISLGNRRPSHFQTMLGHLRHANSSFFWTLFFHSVFLLYTCATYWHSCDMHFVSLASLLAISDCIRVYHGLDAHVALCLSLRHEIMMQMLPSFPLASGVSRGQFASQGTSQTHHRRFDHCNGQSKATLCGHIRRRSFAIFVVMVLLLYCAALLLAMYLALSIVQFVTKYYHISIYLPTTCFMRLYLAVT